VPQAERWPPAPLLDIDLPALHARIPIIRGLVAELEAFFSAPPKQPGHAERAIEQGDAENLPQRAHALKGAACQRDGHVIRKALPVRGARVKRGPRRAATELTALRPLRRVRVIRIDAALRRVGMKTFPLSKGRHDAHSFILLPGFDA